MARALEVARQARGRTHPNPPVGAVVVADHGAILGEGVTQPAGGDHAEVKALHAAGPRTSGATLAVTLEPCNHHGHTPPCTQAILRAGIRRVIAAIPDTNPGVRGGGFDFLRSQGVQVVTGVGARPASDLAQGHFKLSESGRPHVTAKWAMTLDGKVARPSGGGRITGDAAWRRVHEMRDAADAIITGVDSILVDDSRLTVRPPPADGRQPLRVVFDSMLRTRPTSRIIGRDGKVLLLTTAAAPPEQIRRLREAGGQVLTCTPTPDGRVDITAALDALGELRLSSVLLEAGPTLTGTFLAAGAIDSLSVFVAPWTMGPGIPTPTEVDTLLDRPRISKVGDDTLIEGDLHRYGPAVD